MPPDEEVATQLCDLHGRAEQRWLVIHSDGEAAGQLVVYTHDGLAQIEDVAVLRRFQGRGLSRRLIGHALALLAADHDTVFITAEADDWPRELYARLGFEHVEDRADFLLIKAG
jgi:ribosomal protein S18 acetylase RimI-like enzyme